MSEPIVYEFSKHNFVVKKKNFFQNFSKNNTLRIRKSESRIWKIGHFLTKDKYGNRKYRIRKYGGTIVGP